MPEQSKMYLEHQDWSHRFQDTFYTVLLDGFELMTAPSETDYSPPPDIIGGKTSFPAYFYKIKVFCGHRNPKVVYRRYSQFQWLYKNMPSSVIGSGANKEAIVFPPGSCVPDSQNDDVAKARMEQLGEFLRDALIRMNVASHEAVVAKFLELDSFAQTTPAST